MSEDETPDIDWALLRGATTNLTEIVWTYFAGLVAAGFDQGSALALTLAFQQTFLEQMHG